MRKEKKKQVSDVATANSLDNCEQADIDLCLISAAMSHISSSCSDVGLAYTYRRLLILNSHRPPDKTRRCELDIYCY